MHKEPRVIGWTLSGSGGGTGAVGNPCAAELAVLIVGYHVLMCRHGFLPMPSVGDRPLLKG